jgi:hypothetical protein
MSEEHAFHRPVSWNFELRKSMEFPGKTQETRSQKPAVPPQASNEI